MIELRKICREAAVLRSRQVPFLLATVVRVSGSGYRRPGARMLMAEHRWIAGSVSGGCLERDVLTRGLFRTRSGGPVVVTYDSGSDDDIGAALGVGCNGVIDVLIERIEKKTPLDPTYFAETCFAAEKSGALVTVIASDDPSVPIGARIAARDASIAGSTIPEGATRELLARAALDALAGAERARILVAGGVTALVELFQPPPHLFVIGTRHDAVSLVELARAMHLDVTVADAWVDAPTRKRFGPVERWILGPPRAIARAVDAHARAVVVVMTHVYERDRDYLAAILETRAHYVGVLGPRSRTARMLAEGGVELTSDVLARLHAPVGLDLGAETPYEIALAILAEIQASFARASARRLRERAGPIHGATAVTETREATGHACDPRCELELE